MKLAALGVVTVAIGIGQGITGLVAIGVFWVLVGPLMRLHGKRLKEMQEASPDKKPAMDGRTFAIGTALWLLLGVPSLLVGVLELGIDAGDSDWKWLPIIVGGIALFFGVVGGGLYLLGDAVGDYADRKAAKHSVPATLRIRSVRETGSYINERPRLEFGFAVEPDAGTGVASYEVTKKATTPFTAMGSLKVGDGFRADVAGPEDPTEMEIHWDQPVPGSGSDSDDVSARLDALDVLKRDGKVTEAEYADQRARILGTL